MKVEVIENLVRHTESAAVVGGHYCVAPDLEDLSADAETEQNTFAFAAELVSAFRSRGKRAILLLWVNDIGIDVAEREALKSNYQLPTPYASILSRADLTEQAMTVVFESTVRNKASSLLRTIFKKEPALLQVLDSNAPELMRCIDQCDISDEVKRVYVIPGPENQNLVVKEGPSPKCNLILGTLFHLIAKRIAPEKIITIFNVIYINRIRLGMHVAENLLRCKVPIHSLLMDGDLLIETADPRLVPVTGNNCVGS